MDKFELLSMAVDLAYDGKHKEAWNAVHNADSLVIGDDKIYDNLRDAVCTTLTALNRMSRKAVDNNE